MNGEVETALVIGRAANYVYGAAKAGFTAFLSGLRGRLVASGVHSDDRAGLRARPHDRRDGPAAVAGRGAG